MKTIALALCAALAAATAAQADTPLQFDLVCTGTVSDFHNQTRPWSQRIAVDLAREAFCPEGCGQVSRILQDDPGQLVLFDSHGDPAVYFAVNRHNGAVDKTTTSRQAMISDVVKGACTVGPFTPLPPNLF